MKLGWALLGLGAGVGWLIWHRRSEAAAVRAAELHAARQDQLEGAAWDAVQRYAERGHSGSPLHQRALDAVFALDYDRTGPLRAALDRARQGHHDRAMTAIDEEYRRGIQAWNEEMEAREALRALAAGG